ncbi:MAG: chondroitinase-B domain-containing protein [Anditalea sp.]
MSGTIDGFNRKIRNVTICSLQLLFFLSIAFLAKARQTQTVTSSKELTSALSTAGPGSRIEIKQGTYSNWGMVVSVSGTKEKPIVISGSENRKTAFSGDGTAQSFFTITGDHVYLENLVFEEIKFTRSIVRLVESEGSAISNCVFRNNQALRQWSYMISIAGNGKSNEIRNSHFEKIIDAVLIQVSVSGLRRVNPERSNTLIKQEKEKQNFDPENPVDLTTDIFPIGTKIHHNLFTDIPRVQWNNGGECIQVGQYQNRIGEAMTMTEVFENKFIRYNGEGEIISNKSSGNSYYNNYFEDCEGSLVIRGGHDCKIFGNVFRGGAGGFRIYGTGHEVYENTIEGTKRGILLGYGTGRGKELTFYTAVENCTIRNNRIINSEVSGIYVGYGKGIKWHHVSDGASIGKVQNVAPQSNFIFNNLIVGPPEKAIIINGAPDNKVRDNTLTRIQKLNNQQ